MVNLAKERLLKVKELTERFRVHRRTVEGWFSRGLECVMVGGLLYTSEEALERFSQPRDSRSRSTVSIAPTADEQRRMLAEAREVGLI